LNPSEAGRSRPTTATEAVESDQVGRILSIALRTGHRELMALVERATARAGSGLVGDHGSSAQRGLTLIASKQWHQVNRELEASLPWHRRRANVLVEASSLANLIGRHLRIGPVRVHVLAETKPCTEMERVHPGLLAALVPDCRGGVYGRVMDDGEIQVGDPLVLLRER